MTAEARLDDSYALIGSVAFVLTFRGGQHPHAVLHLDDGHHCDALPAGIGDDGQ